MAKLGQDGTQATRRLRDLGRRCSSAPEVIIKSGIQSGEFRSTLDPRLASYAILGAVNWTHRWFKPGKGPSATEIADVSVEINLMRLEKQ
jgi:hypothetical protein